MSRDPAPSASPQIKSLAVSPVLGLEDDEVASRIVQEEIRLLETVQRALDVASRSDVETARGRQLDDARLLELREDVAVAKPEDLPALFEQMHHVGALRAQRGRGALGNIDRNSPYFGHIRLEESGRRRDILIGSRSYVDSAAGIRIVDWRHAPVSKIFYRYCEEDDYEEPLGDRLVEGSVLARRTVAIVGGEVVRVAAPQGTFVRGKDGVWKRVDAHRSRLATEKTWARGAKPEGVAKEPEKRLGIGADGQLRQDKHLPAIASLLDAAQFELIAKPGAGLVAIQGSAGSGKTTVGLHRVAYLNFTEPQRFRADKMLVVVPNEALIHYVGRVLPSLGVEDVTVTTFSRFATRIFVSLFPKMPTVLSDDTPPVVSRAKSHGAMLRAIEKGVDEITRHIDERLRETMTRWEGGEVVLAAWDKTRTEARTPPDIRVNLLSAWFGGKRNFDGVPHPNTLPQVTRGTLERLGHELRNKSRGVTALWDELLTSRERLAATFQNVSGFGTGQLEQVYEWCVKQARTRAEGERDGEVASYDFEDVALLLRCWQSLRGPLVDSQSMPIRFNHVFVDEVQDASPVELRVLIDVAGKDRCITLAGDIAQRMLDEGDDRGEFDWNRLLTELEVPHTKLEPLKVSYRSTAEITEFARAVLGPLAHEAEPIATRHGPPVELFGFASPGEAVAYLADVLKQLAQDEPESNVALIARFGPQADMYYEGLVRAEVPNVRRVAKQDFTWDAGVDVTDVRQTKGLEFDEVVLIETTAATYPTTGQARHAMYVAATRASHQLWCVSSEKPSELVTSALGNSSTAEGG